MGLKKKLTREEFDVFFAEKLMNIEMNSRQLLFEQRFWMKYMLDIMREKGLDVMDYEIIKEMSFDSFRRKEEERQIDFFDLDDLDF